MGLEKVVLNAVADANTSVADNAYFENGTLFIRNAGMFNAVDMYRVMNAIKSVVTCDLDLNITLADEFAIDFM